MKLLDCIAMGWLGVSSVFAQGPSMTDATGGNTLPVEEAEVRVRVMNGVAETSVELNFRNESDRMVEGEFVMPLPEGATVSSYALEVQGELRAAVAVEKERARHAYESIKRQMIDPGLVEREAGNVYRTRVFPVPERGTKRLRIGYVQTLPVVDGSYEYRLPLELEGKVKAFACMVSGLGKASFEGEAGLDFKGLEDGDAVAGARAREIDGVLVVREPVPERATLMTGTGGEFVITDVFPEMAAEERPRPERVSLFWDASESMGQTDAGPTLEVLDAWFGRVGGRVQVELVLVRDAVEPLGNFTVEEGDWGELRQVLEAVDYEGATSFFQVGAPADRCDVAIYCGDGVGSLEDRTALAASPLHVLRRGGGEVSKWMELWVRRSGGVMMDADAAEPGELARRMVELRPRLIAIEGEGVRVNEGRWQQAGPGEPVVVTGTLGEEGSSVDLCYGVGDRVLRRRAAVRRGEGEGMVERLWAQQKLAELEGAPEPRRKEIVEHCKRRGLVSGETSLIVLERFEDHVRYEIPPPEEHLRKRYFAAISAKPEPTGTDGLTWLWRHRVRWHETDFPGPEHVLLPRLRQVEVWKNAVESVFEPGDLDAEAFGTVAGWCEEVRRVIADRDGLEDGEDYEAWRVRIGELDKRGEGLKRTPISDKRPLAVSVRGLVEEPGVVRAEEAMNLEDAVGRAGGGLPYAQLDAVSLYRNGGKVTYNTLSRQYEPVPLKPGDMVVVESGWRYDGDIDPFAPEATLGPEGGPAVIAQRDLWMDDGVAGDGGFGGDGIGSRVKEVRVAPVVEAGMPDFGKFERALAAGEDAEAAYRELRGERPRALRFYIEASRRLYAAGREALGRRVLSTLVERGGGAASAHQAFAFWLAEFGRVKEAERAMSGGAGDGESKVQYLALTGHLDPAENQVYLVTMITDPYFADARAVALAELNRRRPVPHPIGDGVREVLPADIRVVVVGDDVELIPQVELIAPTENLRRTGGRVTRGPGVWEFMDRDAEPGIYRLRLKSEVDASFRIALHLDWGREGGKTEWLTRFVAAGEEVELAELEFEFEPEEGGR